jgi:hypothetical protein
VVTASKSSKKSGDKPAVEQRKITLSLPASVIRALRIAAAEQDKDMSDIVTEALKQVGGPVTRHR